MFHRVPQIMRQCLLGVLALAVFPLMAEAAGRKLALVVGNEAYETLPGLATPVADAQAMSKALRDLGFEVTLLTDVGPEVFQAVLGTFAGQVDQADTVLFYYSGHAFQMGGVNHLVPVGAKLADQAALQSETWRLDDIAKVLKGKTSQLLLFLDACRDTPLPDAVKGIKGVETGGLAQFDGGAGTFVAFATAPGAVAWDKTEGSANSPFTAALLRNIATPGQTISDLMIAVRNDVGTATGGKQTPWDQSSLREQFFFAPLVDDPLPAFDLAEQASAIVPPPGGISVIGQGGADEKLAAMDSDTRSLNAKPPPDNLPLAVQDELKRVGCYGMRVDGQWGNGSRLAMTAYYKAKKVDAGEMEPTEAAWRMLAAEPAKVCETPAQVTKAPSKPKATTKKPAATTTTKNTATKPAPTAPAKTAPKCKFMVIAVVCS